MVGYIDDDNNKAGKRINGVPVYNKETLSAFLIKKLDITEIIVSINNIPQSQLRELVEGLVDYPVQVKIVPPVEDWINGELRVSQIKQVQIEDILNRTPINIKNSSVVKELRGQVIMVTGGAGSIGGEIVRQIAKYEYRSLIVIDQAESALYDLQQELKQAGFHNFIPIVADIRDKNRMNTFFHHDFSRRRIQARTAHGIEFLRSGQDQCGRDQNVGRPRPEPPRGQVCLCLYG